MDLTIEIKGPRASDESLELAAALTSVEGIRISAPPEPSRFEPTSVFLIVSVSLNLVTVGLNVWNRIDTIRKPGYNYTIKLPNGDAVTFEGPEAQRRMEEALTHCAKSQNRD